MITHFYFGSFLKNVGVDYYWAWWRLYDVATPLSTIKHSWVWHDISKKFQNPFGLRRLMCISLFTNCTFILMSRLHFSMRISYCFAQNFSSNKPTLYPLCNNNIKFDDIRNKIRVKRILKGQLNSSYLPLRWFQNCIWSLNGRNFS